MYTDCDKQIIAGLIINSGNPVKVEMYSHSRSVLFFSHQTYQWLMAFYPFLHPHTDSPEEKLNLVVNKAILIAYHLPPPPPPPQWSSGEKVGCIWGFKSPPP